MLMPHDPPLLPRLLVVGTILAFWPGSAARAQDTTSVRLAGGVQGVVFDSTLGEPLPDAAVYLWGTSHRAVSDSTGRYAIEGVPPGEYSVVFYHTRLAELGVSTGSRRLRVAAGTTARMDLGTPSWFTLTVNQCLLEPHAPGTGVVAGWVGDGDSGMGIPNAKVTLSWGAAGSAAHTSREIDTDGNGWYRLCDAPTGTPIAATARFLTLQGLRREVVAEGGGAVQASFLLWELRPGRVSGTVHDAASGQGVEGAEIRLRGTRLRAITGKDGAFRFGEIPPGEYTLLLDHLAYGSHLDTLVVPSGRTIAVDLRLDTRAIGLSPLTIVVEAVPLTQRSRGGLTITREQIERLGSRARDAAEVIQALNLPGVTVRRRADGSLCVGYAPGQASMMSFGGCVSMEVYINDVHAVSADMALHVPPEAVERIVLFRPVEAGNLFPINAANGVIVIYTRH
jgi:hypothetical protein